MTYFENQKLLVVGGAGFVGSNLVKKLLTMGVAEVIVVDNLLSADSTNIPMHSALQFINASINEDEVLYGLPDDLNIVFHLATYHGNQSSIENPLKDHEHNTLTSLKLFDRISKFKQIEKVVYAGAGCTVAKKTFDAASATEEQEEVSLYLDSPYQMSKIFGEFYGNYYLMRYGLPFVKARFQNVYGPGEMLGAGQWRGNMSTIWRNVTPSFIFRALHHQALPLENNGIATRDFIYVDDIVDGLLACASKGKAGEVYNLASGVETSIAELAKLINEITGNPTPLECASARPWDRSGKRFGHTQKSERELGFRAKVTLPEGLEKTIQWTRDNLGTINRCIQNHHWHLEDNVLNFL